MTSSGLDRLHRRLLGTRAHDTLLALPIETPLRPAAVLVAIIDAPDVGVGDTGAEPSILLTVRASGLRRLHQQAQLQQQVPQQLALQQQVLLQLVFHHKQLKLKPIMQLIMQNVSCYFLKCLQLKNFFD